MADNDLLSMLPGPEGGTIRTPSKFKLGGMKALMAAGEVPGGRDDRRSVGLGGALSCSLPGPVLSSSSDS